MLHKSADDGGHSRKISKQLLKKMDKWLRRSRADKLYEAIDEQDYENSDPDSFVGTAYAFVTTYDNIRLDAETWQSHDWSVVILDEGQKIRNPDADVTLSCKRLKTPHRYLLSGTPIQNDLRELWSLFDFVFPGRLGTLPSFESEFADVIRKGGYSNASPMQVALGYRCALALKDIINPYLLRRQKKDVKEMSKLPGKTEHVLFCRLSKRQRILYEAYLESDAVKSAISGTGQIFKPIIVLRKICNHPDLVCGADQDSLESFARNSLDEMSDSDSAGSHDESEEKDIEVNNIIGSLVERSGKLQVLAKILPLWHTQGHRVLIFSQWKKTLNIIQRFVSEMGWNMMRMDGSTNIAARQTMVDRFNADPSIFGMLMTTRTGGVGLNLTGANRILLFDPDWNPQTDAQARERAWRYGQSKSVTVYRLIVAGTIEEKIYHRQIFKTGKSLPVPFKSFH
jgi:DNA excision repair protein ERCC-6